jgi:cytochrome bd ubiquinol oxidase subunit II
VEGDGLPALITSVLAGLVALALVAARRFELARYTAALAVAAIVAGWALAQKPILLPGLTVQEAAAPRDTLVALVVAVIAGGVILFPALALLFRLYLGGRFHAPRAAPQAPRSREGSGNTVTLTRTGLLSRSALACLLAGFGFLNVANAGWTHVVGVVSLLAFVVLGFLAVVPSELD